MNLATMEGHLDALSFHQSTYGRDRSADRNRSRPEVFLLVRSHCTNNGVVVSPARQIAAGEHLVFLIGEPGGAAEGEWQVFEPDQSLHAARPRNMASVREETI